MNCRTFHRNLEDYLENGLDFAGRFGMERHAQQCIGCEKVLADAQRLGQMARELKRVQAPAGFEDAILKKIGNRKLHSRFSRFRNFWIYSFDRLSWQKLALSSCSAALLLLGVFFAFNHHPLQHASPRELQSQQSVSQKVAPPKTPEKPAIIDKNFLASAQKTEVKRPKSAVKRTEIPPPVDVQQEELLNELQDADYVEYLIVGPGNRPVTVRTTYGQPSEEFYIRNVSH
jgi:hypothetical protein